jgi:tRNA G18 (ribose-2'-O)-methylase SpoU
MFRTAEAAGLSRIYLSGFSPTPLDRFGRPRSDFNKAALGTEAMIAWEAVLEPLLLIDQLKKEGFFVVILEQDKRAVDYRNIPKNKKVLIVVGSEVPGVSAELKEKADVIAEIPMEGKKESLNVSVALGVLLFSLLSKN